MSTSCESTTLLAESSTTVFCGSSAGAIFFSSAKLSATVSDQRGAPSGLVMVTLIASAADAVPALARMKPPTRSTHVALIYSLVRRVTPGMTTLRVWSQKQRKPSPFAHEPKPPSTTRLPHGLKQFDRLTPLAPCRK